MSTRVPFSISKTVPARMQGVHRGIDHPSQVINHHAPPTPRSTQSTGLFKRASDSTGTFSRRRVFRGKGQQQFLESVESGQ